MHVAEAADFTVQQIFAFSRPIQPARHLHRAAYRSEVVAFARFEQIDVGTFHDVAQPQPDFRRAGGLPRVAAVENDVLHLVAAQALRALLAEHPRNGVGNIALTAAVGAHDGGDAAVERQMHPVGEGLEAGDFQVL